MNESKRRAVLVVGHGSRREEANEDVRTAARRIGERGGFDLIEAAFLEITSPNISEGFTQLVERGAQHIIVHPYFLSPGRHTRGDIPVDVREAADRHPGVSFQITEPLCAHRLVIDASIERIRETEDEETFIARELSVAQPGKVYIVGAGPGDPSLLTIKARDLISACDVIVYDYLVNPAILSYANDRTAKIYVGKVGGGWQTPQDEINDLLITHARAGRNVVRLKGGDPFIFGRGGEECEALREAGISYEVVPGISSVLSVPAYAGIPLTHRSLASSVTILTGTNAGDVRTCEHKAGLYAADTLVILMGMSRLAEIAAELIDAGRDAETPVAVIRRGTYEIQQTVVGTLSTIAEDVESARLRAPAVIVVGEVVRLRESLKWFAEQEVCVSDFNCAYFESPVTISNLEGALL